jgi:hypothetical protein
MDSRLIVMAGIFFVIGGGKITKKKRLPENLLCYYTTEIDRTQEIKNNSYFLNIIGRGILHFFYNSVM